MIPILAIAGFWGAIITFIYMFFKSRHSQRMALIESGKTAEIFSEIGDEKTNAFKFGLLFTGLGLGFLLGVMVEQIFNFPEAAGIIPLTVIGGGLGLIIFYLITSKKENNY
ncbi:MAG: hypothetical protein KJO50_11055 [Bacteroidia bacterium]|nr:hypothetical protein [Bacteroidia bacterium]MBT8230789.1 hypothetical protein [Bacteroidia bacterium]NNK89660.1 hypothetical protein [Saprospiraceae bacterium]